jgi:hypothetical protein
MKSELNASELSRVPPTKRKRGPQQGGVVEYRTKDRSEKTTRGDTDSGRCAVCGGGRVFLHDSITDRPWFHFCDVFCVRKSSKGGIRKLACSNTRNAAGNVPVEAVGAAIYYWSLCNVSFGGSLETENVFGRQTKEERNFSPLGKIVAVHLPNAAKINETCEGDRW